MSFPWLTASRIRPLRRLTDDECDLLEYAGPLVLARREHRFLIGPWRPTRALLVATHASAQHDARVLMVCTDDQLRARGIEPWTE